MQHGFRCLYHQEGGKVTHHQMSEGSLNGRTFQEKAPLILLGKGRTLTPRWERAPRLVAPPSLFTQQPIQVRVPRALADAVCILKLRIAVGTPDWPLASTPSSSIFSSHPGLISSPWKPHTHSFWGQGPACSFSHECD